MTRTTTKIKKRAIQYDCSSLLFLSERPRPFRAVSPTVTPSSDLASPGATSSVDMMSGADPTGAHGRRRGAALKLALLAPAVDG